MKSNSPFKFLDAYTLKDSEYFFGRDKEIDELYKMVFSTPLTLIYGLSGTGKTSLVQCGLASRFDGPDWFPFFIRRNDNIIDTLHNELNDCIDGNIRPTGLIEKISHISSRYLRPVYLIFDQFEELFILGKEEEQTIFINEIKKLIDAKLHCKIIFIIREEYLGQLYDFEKVIPYIFDFRLRVEPMNVKTTSTVLTSSFTKFNITLEPPEEDRINQIIQNVSGEKSGIQLPYLQVYLDSLYRKDYKRTYPNGSDLEFPPLEFTRKEIKKIGKIDNVLEKFLKTQREFLEKEMTIKFEEVDKDAVIDLLDAFVTEEGTKRPFYFSRDEDLIIVEDRKNILPKISIEAISFAVKELEQRRILRVTSDTTFELAHDSLAKLIDQKRTDEQRQRNEAKNTIMTIFSDFGKTEQLLSKKQLDQYMSFIPLLRLDEEVQDFIDKSYENEKRLQVEKLELAKKEATSKLRKKLLWVIGTLAIIATGFGVVAGIQNKRAQISKIEAEKHTANAKLLNYKNLIASAKTFKAQGNYKKAKDQIDLANVFLEKNILQDAVLKKYVNIDSISPSSDSLIIFKNNWSKIYTFINEGDTLYNMSMDDNLQKNEDLKLKEALGSFEAALKIDPNDEFLKNKVKTTEEMLNQKFKIWMERASRFTNYNQYDFAREAIYFARKLNLNPSRVDEINKIEEALKE